MNRIFTYIILAFTWFFKVLLMRDYQKQASSQ